MKTLTMMTFVAAACFAISAFATSAFATEAFAGEGPPPSAGLAVGDCLLDIEAERPGPEDPAEAWRRWWIDAVGVHEGAVFDEAAPGESLWMVLIQCGPSWYARGVRFDEDAPVVEVESTLSTEYCCGADGFVPESIGRLIVGERSFPAFEIRGQTREGGGETTSFGETSVYYFPGREVEYIDAPPAEELRTQVSLNGYRYIVDYGSNAATGRYNVSVGPGFVSVSRDVFQRDMKTYRLEVDEDQSMLGYYCRSVEAELRVGSADDDFDLLIRQEVTVPVGSQDCFDYYQGSPDGVGIEPREVGFIERRLRVTDDRVIVHTRQELNEFVDLP